MKKINVNGQKFGRLLVIGEADIRGRNGRIMMYCLCDCGNKHTVRKSLLTNGISRSCGCLNIETKQKQAGKTSIVAKFCAYRRSAKKRGYEFHITEGQFSLLCSNNCNYCGKPPKAHNRYYKLNGSLLAGRTHKDSADRAWIVFNGIDRMNNDIGYTIDNCVPCCSRCNLAKGKMSGEEYITHCKKVALYQGNKK